MDFEYFLLTLCLGLDSEIKHLSICLMNLEEEVSLI